MIYGIRKYKGKELIIELISTLRNRGFNFITISELYKRLINK